ncbi:Gfo/Idh/MocA family protein [Stratiformator vulcanicus]|uniref:Inositol 2-dehydrogenase n=1 Tax=Stratiformator vulcanicus TaxID=2527980 RepID=A0A517QYL2_9PLAN|nr:Gfo/Idh/MocA family oxidoreductase [Stratiformator vulcanicus]QDT36684.1 Inositol 2-dehydrogenase [Stratiformator vulcanicus]
MTSPSRRDFLATTSAVAGAAALAGPASAAKSDANDRIRVAVIGVRNRGKNHIEALAKAAEDDNVEIAAICDCHLEFAEKAADKAEELVGYRPRVEQDLRKIMDDASIDAVTIATPNHWHALATVWACEAGKDVYVEKPGTQNFDEGEKVVAAARQNSRIVQHGTQCRGSANIQEGMQKLKEGVIGRPYMARMINYKFRGKPLGKHSKRPVPKELDWDLWCGPGPLVEYSNFNFYRNNWTWDFGVGDLGNQGVHQLDMVRWGLGLDRNPDRVQAMGGNLVYPDSDIETPNTLACSYEWGNGDDKLMVTAETREGCTNVEGGMGTKYPFVDHKNAVGVIFYGTEGYMQIADYSSYRTFLGRERTPGPYAAVEGAPMMDADHVINWVKCIRSRRKEDLAAEIAEGVLSSNLCHLGNVAYRAGQTLELTGGDFSNKSSLEQYLTRDEYRAPYQMPQVI